MKRAIDAYVACRMAERDGEEIGSDRWTCGLGLYVDQVLGEVMFEMCMQGIEAG